MLAAGDAAAGDAAARGPRRSAHNFDGIREHWNRNRGGRELRARNSWLWRLGLDRRSVAQLRAQGGGGQYRWPWSARRCRRDHRYGSSRARRRCGNRSRTDRHISRRSSGDRRHHDRRRCARRFRLQRGDRPQIIGFGGGGQRARIDIAHDAQHRVGLVLGRERSEPQPVTRTPVFHALNLVHVRGAGGKERFGGLAERGAGRAQVDHEGPGPAQAR